MTETSKIMAWLKAIRLRTLPLALASITMGSFLAGADGGFNMMVFILSAITTIFLQILSNLANDYGDSVHGADSQRRQGPKRTVQSGLISPASMRMAIYSTVFLALVSGIWLLVLVFDQVNSNFAVFLFLGLAAILAALGYTLGSKPYGYAGLGDLFVLIFFGPVGVLGTYYLHTGALYSQLLLPALSSGFFATAVLNVNNIRDIKSDEEAGKRSIPVRLGRKNAVRYHIFLIISGLTTIIIYNIIDFNNIIQFTFIFTIPLFIKNIRDVKNRINPSELDPSLKYLALTILFFTFIFGVGILLV